MICHQKQLIDLLLRIEVCVFLQVFSIWCFVSSSFYWSFHMSSQLVSTLIVNCTRCSLYSDEWKVICIIAVTGIFRSFFVKGTVRLS